MVAIRLMDNYRRRPRAGPRRGEDGYTLMEILIVLALLALVAAFAVPNLMNIFGSAKHDAAEIQLGNLATILDIFRLDNDRYPVQDEGLAALINRPADSATWNGPYLERETALNDPWGNPYRYLVPGQHGPQAYDIYTLGADNAEGGDGDDRDIWH